MNHKFDELTKSLAQCVTRRQALRRFGVGLAGVMLATLGLANRAEGKSSGETAVRNSHASRRCKCNKRPYYGCGPTDASCVYYCETYYCAGGY
jgi:hypothetical protein